MVGAQITPLREQLDRGALGSLKDNILPIPGTASLSRSHFHTVLAQLLCNVTELGVRRDLKGNSLQVRTGTALFSNSRDRKGAATVIERSTALTATLRWSSRPMR
jgi:hypothetical protein